MPLKAVIMAGGEGSRLRPLTCARPKPMVPIMNRPCMEYIIDLLRYHRITEIAVTLQYLPDEIRNYFGKGGDFGVNLRYFVEDNPLGTAGSVRNAASFLDETFIVISGDALTDCDLKKAYDFHREKGALATLVLTSVPCPLEYGVVITDREGRITRFLEKPGWGEVFSDTVNTGIYILEPEVLDYIQPGKMVDFSKDLYPMLLAAGRPLYAFVAGNYWCDVGSVEAYLQAHYDMLDRKAEIPVGGVEIRPGVWVTGRAEVDPAAQLRPPVLIGDGCVIDPGTVVGPYTVLGREVRVKKNASLKRSVVWDHALVGEGAEIRGAVIGTGVRIMAASFLLEGSVVGDRTVIGERSLVKAGVKIWPEKWVEKGTRLSRSLVWGNCVRSHVFGANGISGDLVAEISPEFASRIGVAVGSVAGLPARFALSTDGHTCSRMVQHAVFAGLMSTGVQVIDFGSITAPVHRYGIRTLRLNGGIHICYRGSGKVNLRLFNDQGIEYSRNEQRRVEGMLGREEYRYVGAEEIPTPEYIPELNRSYLHFLLEFLEREVTRRARLKVVVDYDAERLGSLLPPLFEQLGCEMVTFAAPRPDRSFGEELQPVEHFGEVVREQGADFGAVLETGGEDLVLVDERGRVIPRDLFLSLLSLIVLRANERPTLVLPVTAPDALEEMVRERGGKVLRAKTAPWSLMRTFLAEEVLGSQKRCPQFLLYGDALATLAVIIEFLAREKRPLSRLIQEIPPFSLARREVEVTWDDKGKVLRFLAEEAGERRVEMIEGIKMYHPEGWALVLPDAEEPLCRVYSEGFNQEIAESLTEMYVDKIRGICESRPEGNSSPL